MNRALTLGLVMIATLSLTGCKIVFDSDKDTTEIPVGPEGDATRNAQRLDETFEQKLLPYVREHAVSIDELRTQIGLDIGAFGDIHAQRGSGAGAAWNFPVSGSGVVIEAVLDKRARTLSLDTDADGSADTTVQLGPVIKGTALRDGAPFYNFDDFRDQIEYAKLARALNDRISEAIALPEGDLVGRTVGFLGVTPLASSDDAIVVTPLEVTFPQ